MGLVNAIAQHHHVWVLTAGYHRRDLEEALRSEPEKVATCTLSTSRKSLGTIGQHPLGSASRTPSSSQL